MDLHLSPLEPDVHARLLFLKSDELLFQWNDDTNNLQSKLIAHQDARIAFAKMDNDTGWLPDGVVRAGRKKTQPGVLARVVVQPAGKLANGASARAPAQGQVDGVARTQIKEVGRRKHVAHPFLANSLKYL